MRRPLVIWSVAFVLLFAAFGITLVALNGTVYSAGGFVGSYLNALARQDATAALATPGVVAAKGARTQLLTDDALGTLTDITLVSDDADPDGIHTVTYEYTIGGELGSSDYRVKPSSAFLGLFSGWSFAESPLATISVSVLHDTRFRVNGVDLTSPAKASKSAAYTVFAPGLYNVDHKSAYLEAEVVPTAVTDVGSNTPVRVNVQANATFEKQVSSELRDYLMTCAKQQVLLPTGCPFGKSFDNRVDSTPQWSIADYPSVSIVPGSKVGEWLMPETDAAAHLKVKVQSLFDGSVTTFNRDVPFSVAYDITIATNNDLRIEAQYD